MSGADHTRRTPPAASRLCRSLPLLLLLWTDASIGPHREETPNASKGACKPDGVPVPDPLLEPYFRTRPRSRTDPPAISLVVPGLARAESAYEAALAYRFEGGYEQAHAFLDLVSTAMELYDRLATTDPLRVVGYTRSADLLHTYANAIESSADMGYRVQGSFCRALEYYRRALAIDPVSERALQQVVAYGPAFERGCESLPRSDWFAEF